MTAWRDGWRLAVGTLTGIPVPAPARVGRGEARVAMLVGWLAALPVTLAAAAVAWGMASAGVPHLASGLVGVGVLQLLTRGMHADGLADTVDGLGVVGDRDKSLAVMRRGDVGPLGAAALVVVLGAQASVVGELAGRPGGWLLAGLALASGRLALTLGAAAGVPAARPDGLGAAVAGSVPRGWAVGMWLAAAAAGTGLVVLVDALTGSAAGLRWWSWAVGAALAAVSAAALCRQCVRRFGGITGDVLGALVEVAALAFLLGAALA